MLGMCNYRYFKYNYKIINHPIFDLNEKTSHKGFNITSFAFFWLGMKARNAQEDLHKIHFKMKN